MVCILGGITYADSNKIFNPDNGHYYQRIDTPMTWHNAKTYCESLSGYLATITSIEENQFIYNNLVLPAGNHCWLGGTDEAIGGVWQWITGEPWEYTNWACQEPNGLEHENYLEIYGYEDGSCSNEKAKWNDEDNNGQDDYLICEWDELLPCTCTDSDSDGVPDAWDQCSDTPAGSCTNKHGCLCEGLYTEKQMNQMVSNILTWGDTNNDGKIGLAEAIHALRITSGVTQP